MFGRDKGFGVPVGAVTTEGADGREKRVELFVGESSSAEEDERTEKRDGGGCAIMTEMTLRVWIPKRIGGFADRPRRDITRFALYLLAVPLASPSVLNITSQEVSQRPTTILPE